MRRAGAIVTFLCAAAGAVFAQSAGAWRHWQYFAPIVTPAPAPASPRLTGIVVPASVAVKSRSGLDDVRVVDGQQVEQPFVLWSGGATRTREWRPARLLDPGFVAGRYTQVVLDLGATPAVHNRLRLDMTTVGDFQTWIEVATGDDARTWQVVRDRAPIYDLNRAGVGEKKEATYPPSVARYVRVRLLDGATRFSIAGAAVVEERTPTVELVATDLVFSPAAAGAQRSAWASQGDADGVFIAEVRVRTTQPQFLRPIAVETSDDGVQWRLVASSEISRATARGQTRESLRVPVWAPPAKRWRVVIYDHDDRPLADVGVIAFVRPRRVIFRETPGQSYRLLFGHSRADAPRYDMAQLTDAEALDAAAPATLGPAAENPDYADPAPWTERHPVVLWAAVGIAVLVLGTLAVRALK